MDTSVDTESKLIKVALLVAIGCLIAVHVLHSLLCHCMALLHHAATATLLHPQLPLLPLYPIRHWKLKTFLLLQVAVSVNSPLGCFMLRDDVCPPPSRACWNTYVKVVNCFLSIYNFPHQKSLPHCLYCCFFPVIRPFMYNAASWIVESLLCFSLFAVLKPFDPFMLSHL